MSAIEKLKEVFPPCYDCGVLFQADSEDEAAEYLRDNAFYLSTLSPKNPDRERVRVRLGYEWVCPTCMFQRENKNSNAEHERRKNLLLERTFYHNKLPRAAIIENFTQSSPEAEAMNHDAWTTARSWDSDFSMWIQGTKGTGKTFMGRCILNQALQQVHSVYEVNSIDFCEWVYRQGEKQRNEAAHIDVLLLDDIDKAEWRVDSLIALWRLLDIRHRDKHVTIITANCAPELMRSRWKAVEGPERTIVEPMIDRMRNFKRITLQGKSLRGDA